MAREHEPWNWSAGLQPGALNAFLPRRTWRSWSSGLRFMESLLSLLRRHWDHEPTPNPSQEGNGQDADRCLFPSWEGSGLGRFMESLLSLLRRHRNHELERAKVGLRSSAAAKLPLQTHRDSTTSFPRRNRLRPRTGAFR